MGGSLPAPLGVVVPSPFSLPLPALGVGVFVVLVGAGSVVAATEGVAASVLGGGACASLTGAGLTAFAVGVIASSIGAAAPLGATGLTAEPTSTPKASNAITATAATAGVGVARPAPVSGAGHSAACTPSLAAWCGYGARLVAAPISSATVDGSAPRRMPHSTQ
jgi:hypothetical protein